MCQKLINISISVFAIMLFFIAAEILTRCLDNQFSKYKYHSFDVDRLSKLTPNEQLQAKLYIGDIAFGIYKSHPTRKHENIPNIQAYTLMVKGYPSILAKKEYNVKTLLRDHLNLSDLQMNEDIFIIKSFSTNSLGFRGDDTYLQKQESEFRILLLGDSITFGYYSNFDETFGNLLENKLKQSGHKKKYCVINAGVANYNTAQELDLLKDKAILVEPDLTILGFYINDIIQDEKDLLIRSTDILFPRRLYFSWLANLRRSKFLSFLEHRICMLKFFSNLDIDSESMINISIESAWSKTLAQIKQMRDFCHAHNSKFAVVVFPNGVQVGRTYTAGNYQKRLIDFGKKENIPIIDILPVFNATGDFRTVYYEQDLIHPKPMGNSLVAEEIYKYVIKNSKI